MGLLSALGLKSNKAKKAQRRILEQQEKALGVQTGFLSAIGAPEGETFQTLQRFIEQDATRDFETALRQALTQSNRSVARGGVGFFAQPERRDESLMQSLAKFRETQGSQARNNVFEILLAASGNPSEGIGQSAANFAELQAAKDKKLLNTATFGVDKLFGGVDKLFGGLFGGVGGGKSPISSLPQVTRT